MAFSRRKFLLGIGGGFGGAMIGLPFFEGLVPKEARAANGPLPYALFYRRGNGVQQAIYSHNCYPTSVWPAPPAQGQRYWFQSQTPEKERWWPVMADGVTPYPFGPLQLGPISAMNELAAYQSQMTVIKGLRHPYGTDNGHPEGAAQGLTGAGLKYTGSTPDVPDFLNCKPMGESLDNVIARTLTPKNPQSLYMGFQTQNDGQLSWYKQGTSLYQNVAVDNLLTIYNNIFLPYSLPDASLELLANQRKSVNDLVREDIIALRNDPRMSKADQDRLAVHLNAIRETEVALAACIVPAALQGQAQGYNPSSITESVDVMGRLAALAISCQVRQSVLINIGIPQDIIGYSEVSAAIGGYTFHAISHRVSVDGNDGSPTLPQADVWHHMIDRFHLQRFKNVLDHLKEYTFPDGTTLVDQGVNVHYSDLGAGQHTSTLLPYLYVGGAQGKLVTGQYINEDKTYLVKFLNTIGAAVGCMNDAGDAPLDDLNAHNGIVPQIGATPSFVVPQNNNYLSRNYSAAHWFPAETPPADGAPPITGRLSSIIVP